MEDAIATAVDQSIGYGWSEFSVVAFCSNLGMTFTERIVEYLKG